MSDTQAHKTGSAPVVVDLGKHKKKQIKRLRKGNGRLMGDVTLTLEDLEAEGVVGASAQPVIIIVREKNKRRPWL